MLGQSDDVSYVEWQAAMLEKEREYDETGSVGVQRLASMLTTRTRNVSDGAFATTVQQSWRGSGFQSMRGGRRVGRYPQQGRHPISQFTQGRNHNANRRQAAQVNNQANRGQATFGNNTNRGNAYGNNNNEYRGNAYNANSGQASNYFAGQCNTCGQHGHIARFWRTESHVKELYSSTL